MFNQVTVLVYVHLWFLGLEMHNKFPLLYQKTAFDFFMKYDNNASDPYAPDYVFYVR